MCGIGKIESIPAGEEVWEEGQGSLTLAGGLCLAGGAASALDGGSTPLCWAGGCLEIFIAAIAQ